MLYIYSFKYIYVFFGSKLYINHLNVYILVEILVKNFKLLVGDRILIRILQVPQTYIYRCYFKISLLHYGQQALK